MDTGINNKENAIQLKQLRSLYDAVEKISSKLQIRDILDSVPLAVKAITGSNDMMIALINRNAEGFEINHETIRHTCPHPSQFFHKNKRQHIAQTVVETNRPTLVLSSGELISYEQTNNLQIDDILFTVIPLSVLNKVIGFLSVSAPSSSCFNHIDIILITIFASQIAIAIENARLHMQMQELILAKERNRIAKEILSVVMKDERYSNIDHVLSPTNGEELTKKERQILILMARGYTNEEIAKELWITPKTVKTHVSSIFRKLGQRNRVQAIVCALKNGLIEFDPT